MWFVLARRTRPDRHYWRGRRTLAALDALGWPLVWIAAALQLPRNGGVIGAVVVVCAVIAAQNRLQLAIRTNHHYAFTTWRWAKAVAILLLGAVIAKTMLGS